MAIEGPLQELGIQEVLQLLDLARKTGVLTVRADALDDEAIVHFSRGGIIFAVRRRSTRRLGTLLLRAGQLTQRELERALEQQRRDPSRRLAEILLELGSVPESQLEQQLRFQMEETIYELLHWDEGYFRFEERAEVARHRLLVSVRVESLLMEGARRIDEWARLEPKIPGADSVPWLSALSDNGAKQIDLRPDEWQVLAVIDGRQDIAALAADLGRSTFEVARTIYGLVLAGLVQIREPQRALPDPQLEGVIAEVDTLLRAGRMAEAERRAGELEQAYPENAALAHLSGRTLTAQGRIRAALEAHARAAALDPLFADAHLALGFSAIRAGELRRAVDAWNTYLRLAPNGGHGPMVAQALQHARALDQLLESKP